MNWSRSEAPSPIEAHGVIGDEGTTALVADDGTIDFLCWPSFDSPSIFAALLDVNKGGAWTISPLLDCARRRQMYLPDTNVLTTRFLAADGLCEITDFMPLPESNGGPRLFRKVQTKRGEVPFTMRCAPRFDYARAKPQAQSVGHHNVVLQSEGGDTLVLRLTSSVPLVIERGLDGDAVVASFLLRAGESAEFLLADAAAPQSSLFEVQQLIEACAMYWHRWASRCTYRGRWRTEILRSALVLKLLTSRKHGSIVAAATFGLPEAPKGQRNWDYRATWIRDASFTVEAFMRLGFRDEALAFRHWIGARVRDQAEDRDGSLQIMYGVDGQNELDEFNLPHLQGFDGANPVRIGNDASTQVQLDIYGELIEAMYQAHTHVEHIAYDGWLHLKRMIEHVCESWRDPDQGIWEKRGPARHWLHSRVMCWTAVDRAIKIACDRSLPAPLSQWLAVRDAIYASVWEEFWDTSRGHFVASLEKGNLDGAMLMLPLVGFVDASDPRWLATLDAIGRELSDGLLLYRYREPDGLAGEEGAFTACSFLYVSCLAKAGRLRQAQTLFETTLSYSNSLGLFSEETGPRGEHLGNTPQALTHLALILAGCDLDAALDRA